MGLLTPLAIRLGASSWLPRFLPQIVWVDLGLRRLTAARMGLLDLAGLPNLVLTVPGRRSGIRRSTPLLYVPYHDTYLIAGSYFGGPKEPVWVANLEAAMTGEMTIDGRVRGFTARRIEGAERDRLWAHMLRTWPNFATYEQRTERSISVFQLIPV